MKTARGKLAVMASLALAGAAVLIPPAPAAPPEAPAPEKPAATAPDTDERPAPQSIFAGTAIGVVLEANNNEVPKSGKEMLRVLKSLGEFAQLPVTYSAVDLHTSLDRPRVVVTMRPSVAEPPPADPKGKPRPFVGGPRGLADGSPVQAAVSTGDLTKPNLEGRLFLAANFEKKNGHLKVKTFEFISWNGRKQRFDFGFIECDEVEPQIRLVDGVKCFSCHKNRGPILGQGPWSNTPHNNVLRDAIGAAIAVDIQSLCLPISIGQPLRLDAGFEPGIVRTPRSEYDGLSVLVPQGPAVDAAVRLGADLARDRDAYRAMLRTADGRKGAVVLLCAIAAPGSLEKNGRDARVTLDQTFSTNFPAFAERWAAIHRTSSSTLIDFNPSGPVGTLSLAESGWGGGTLPPSLVVVWGGSKKQVDEYDAKRAAGDPGLPSNRLPSNPKAFVRVAAGLPPRPSAAVNPTGLARLIGLTEGDRTFIADCLASAAGHFGKKVAPATLAKEVFSGPEFAELFNAGEIPDREDFKDRFVKGLDAALKARGDAGLKVTRANYASGPNVARVPGKEADEAPVVATTACVRCHDVRGPGKPAFNPIPVLAFDPFDKASRENWAKVTPAGFRKPVLARLLKRVAEDRDMPPEDSAEYEAFRTKDPAGVDAIKEWAEAEMRKAKGG